MESDYERRGALQYLCALDVGRGIPWGRYVPKTGILPFIGLVDQVMAMEPYRSAPRVFRIVDNGTSHQGGKSARRLQERHPNLYQWPTRPPTPVGSIRSRSSSASSSVRY